MNGTINTIDIELYVIEKVKNLRVEQGLRQKDIAEIIQTKGSFIGNVENPRNPAKYNLKHIALLAKYFRIPPREFLP
ncbi:helix-turn-helix domain-containing protein [Pedobacter sp. L105]|uniref:helix-turn-helix domain-containing protein n=1 Tax=Pedobacter sp. L105 TaxID=1641871 RepID=UPI00131CB98E|nr:helix-turn-helix transcriptional regulator [Pedobacter sp. L105]